ncbi:MAG: hypothetical protein WCP39_00550, partial [Chlamydiota bacterium]
MSGVYFSSALKYVEENQKEGIGVIGIMAAIEIIHNAGVFSKVKEGLSNFEKRVIHAILPIAVKIERIKIQLKINHLLRVVNNESRIQDIKSKTDTANELLAPSERQDIPPYVIDKHAFILKLVLAQQNLEPTIRTRGTNALLALSERRDIPSNALSSLAFALFQVLKEQNLDPTIRTRAINAILTLTERRDVPSDAINNLTFVLIEVFKGQNIDLPTQARATNAILTFSERRDIPSESVIGHLAWALFQVLKEQNLEPTIRTRAT